jgi:hypothetical protein
LFACDPVLNSAEICCCIGQARCFCDENRREMALNQKKCAE